MAGDIYSAAPYVGRGGWSWYTGSAAWLHRAAVETLLGLAVRGERLSLTPRVPAHWPGFDGAAIDSCSGARHHAALATRDAGHRAPAPARLDALARLPAARNCASPRRARCRSRGAWLPGAAVVRPLSRPAVRRPACRSSTRSQTALTTIMIGMPSSRPQTPHSQPQTDHADEHRHRVHAAGAAGEPGHQQVAHERVDQQRDAADRQRHVDRVELQEGDQRRRRP